MWWVVGTVPWARIQATLPSQAAGGVLPRDSPGLLDVLPCLLPFCITLSCMTSDRSLGESRRQAGDLAC